MNEKQSILIVDDDESTCRTLALIFKKKGYEIETARMGREAIEKMQKKFFNLALLDIRLPDIEGTKLLSSLKEMHPDLEVIIITAHASVKTAVQALNKGASAYITKPLNMDEVLAIVREALRKQHLVVENRRLLKIAQQELAQRKQNEKKLAYMATHDILTNLPNRTLFNNDLTLAIAHAHRHQQRLAVMMLDLDYFKNVNDALGHSMGDKLLQGVGNRLKNMLRKSDIVARIGGDEFLLLLPEINQLKDATRIAQKILGAFQQPFMVNKHKISITISIGIAIYPTDGEDADTLISHADIAMYSVKRSGRNNYQHYTSQYG